MISQSISCLKLSILSISFSFSLNSTALRPLPRLHHLHRQSALAQCPSFKHLHSQFYYQLTISTHGSLLSSTMVRYSQVVTIRLRSLRTSARSHSVGVMPHQCLHFSPDKAGKCGLDGQMFVISSLCKPYYHSSRLYTNWCSGDSYTSTSFNIHGHQPDAENPLGNPAYPGATSSDGPNYVDFLTSTYNQSFIRTYNLGYGGATIDPSLVGSPYGLIVQSFQQQVQEEFLPVYASNPNVLWTSADSLFTVFFGINDVILSHACRNSSLNYALIKSYENLVHQVREFSINLL